MKNTCSLILCLLLFHCSFAQERIDQLLDKLEHVKGDSQKIAVYKQIIVHYSVQNPDSEKWYADQGIKYALKRGYKLGEAMIVSQLAILDENQGRPDIGKERAEYALGIFREQHYLKGVAEMLHNLGATEASKGNFDVAIKYFISALKVYDSVTDNHGLMLAYMNIGNLYIDHQDTANAWKYLRLAEAVSKNTPLSDATIFLNNTIGVLYAERGEPDAALKFFLNDLELSDRPEFVNSHVECLLYLGNFYEEKGDYPQAVRYLDNGLSVARQNNFPEMEANILLEIAKIKEKTDIPSALDYLDKAKVLCEHIHNRVFLATVYNEIAKAYKKQGNYKEALLATEQKQILGDSIFSVNKAKEIANIDDAYKFEKSQMRVSELEILSGKNAKERDIIVVIAFAVSIILITLLFFYRKIILLNRQLIKSRQALKDLNEMKDKLFSVIGHDLRGPVASIPAVLDIYEDSSTSATEKKFILDNLREHSKTCLETLDKLLYWGQSVVKGSRMHQTAFNPKDYINETLEFKKMAAAEKHIVVTDNTADDLRVYIDATHFDFIVRNLLANAIKYTYDNGKIEISADNKSEPGFIVFSVKDNGIGMDKEVIRRLFTPIDSTAGTANEKGNGIGLMLCKEFAVQNGGDIWVESEKGSGTIFYFSVKCAE